MNKKSDEHWEEFFRFDCLNCGGYVVVMQSPEKVETKDGGDEYKKNIKYDTSGCSCDTTPDA